MQRFQESLRVLIEQSCVNLSALRLRNILGNQVLYNLS